MKCAFVTQLVMAATLALGIGLAHASPSALTDAQMDQVSAGGQYSIVEGGGFAEAGTVNIRAATKAAEINGSTMTKASLKIKVVGTGLHAFGFGESGAGNVVSSVYGAASADQGKLKIHVKTMSKVRQDGTGITWSMIKVKTSGFGTVVTRVSAIF